MNDTGAFKLRKHRMRFGTIVIAGGAVAIALGWLATASMHTTAIKAETADTRIVHVEPSTLDTGDTTPAASEIKPSPVIESDPGFFVGAGDGRNGYYAERPAR